MQEGAERNRKSSLNIRLMQAGDEHALMHLIAEFRQSLAMLRGKDSPLDPAAAGAELDEYMEKGFSIYVAEKDAATLMGYLVCRVDGDVVWAESLYVTPETRRQGVGSALYYAGECLSEHLGGDTVYNWVDPNNDLMIHFLSRRGYNVLNLIELRRPYPDEDLMLKIKVEKNEFFSN